MCVPRETARESRHCAAQPRPHQSVLPPVRRTHDGFAALRVRRWIGAAEAHGACPHGEPPSDALILSRPSHRGCPCLRGRHRPSHPDLPDALHMAMRVASARRRIAFGGRLTQLPQNPGQGSLHIRTRGDNRGATTPRRTHIGPRGGRSRHEGAGGERAISASVIHLGAPYLAGRSRCVSVSRETLRVLRRATGRYEPSVR